MRSRMARSKRVTPQDQIKQLQKNISEMKDKYQHDIESMKNRFEQENQLQLENILETGELIQVANEYEQKLGLMEQKIQNYKQQMEEYENQLKVQNEQMTRLKNMNQDLKQWKPSIIEGEMVNYDALMLKYVSLERQSKRELEELKEQGIQQILVKEQEVFEVQQKVDELTHDNEQLQQQMVSKQKQMDDLKYKVNEMQDKEQQVRQQYQQQQQQQQLESEMIDRITSNIEKHPQIGIIKSQYEQQISSLERMIDSMKQQNEVEVGHYNTKMEGMKQQIHNYQVEIDGIKQQMNDVGDNLKKMISQSQYQNRAPLRKLLSMTQRYNNNNNNQQTNFNQSYMNQSQMNQSQMNNYQLQVNQQESRMNNNGSMISNEFLGQSNDYISDFTVVSEKVDRSELMEEPEYELIMRKGNQYLIKKQAEPEKQYEQVVVEYNNKKIKVNRNVKMEEEEILQEIQEDLYKIEEIKQSIISRTDIQEEQKKVIEREILKMEKDCRVKQQVYLEGIKQQQTDGQELKVDGESNSSQYLQMISQKDQEIDKLNILLSQKHQSLVSKWDLNIKLSDDPELLKEQLVEMKFNYKQILEQNQILQTNYTKMKGFYTEQIRQLQQEMCQQVNMSSNNPNNSSFHNNTSQIHQNVGPNRLLYEKVVQENDQLRQELDRSKMQQERLKKHGQRIQDELNWIRDNYNQVLKNNLKLSQQLSLILGQISNSQYVQSEHQQESIRELRDRLQQQ